MTPPPDLADRFLALHRPGTPLLLTNPWDIGSAKILASLGFPALATTSRGFAAALGRNDGAVTRDEAIAHAAAITEATGLPVNGDFEQGFADAPEDVAETVRLTGEAGVAGCSIEDWSGSEIYDFDVAVERVAAAAEAARTDGRRVILTARAENLLRGVDDLDDTIRRLVAFQDAGADVLYAPALRTIEQVRAVIEAVDLPVNVLAFAGLPPVSELAAAGAARISIGAAFALAAYGELVEAATELRDAGTYGYLERTGVGARAGAGAFA